MGFHLFVSICLAIVGTLVSAAFGVGAGLAALIGVIVFLAYWGVLVVWINVDEFF